MKLWNTVLKFWNEEIHHKILKLRLEDKILEMGDKSLDKIQKSKEWDNEIIY